MHGPVLFWHHGVVQYSKPHLAYDQQVQLLARRGLDTGNDADAVGALKRIGYYRLSAYTYPMRAFVPGDGPIRSDQFVDGARLADAVALHDFDHRLRRTLMPAIQSLEVVLRTRVAYRLGKHGALAHLDCSGLDQRECNAASRGPEHLRTKYEVWREEYDALQRKANREDYVAHFATKYEGKVPVWAATEFMTMGCLIGLFRMMQPKDARRIAEEFGVKNQQILFGWLKALNVLRNHCAHNARIWNRSMVYPPDKINVRMVGPDLHHLTSADTHKVYFLASVLAYMLGQVDPQSRFVSDLRTTMGKFPSVLGWTPETTMGFTEQWASEQLWKAR